MELYEAMERGRTARDFENEPFSTIALERMIACENESERARKVLGIPEDHFIPCFLGVGVPAKDARYVRQQEIDPSERIHRDHY